jgi:hypothetical protein
MIGATDGRFADQEGACSNLLFVNLQRPNAVGLSTRSLLEGGLIGAFPHPDFRDSYSQYPASATAGSAPWGAP